MVNKRVPLEDNNDEDDVNNKKRYTNVVFGQLRMTDWMIGMIELKCVCMEIVRNRSSDNDRKEKCHLLKT